MANRATHRAVATFATHQSISQVICALFAPPHQEELEQGGRVG